MKEEMLVSCNVKPGCGRSVPIGGKTYVPGDTIHAIAESAAKRLVRLGVGEIVKEAAAPAGVSSKLVEAITKLDPADATLWTSDGRPQASALAAIVGEEVSAKDRNIAWEEYREEGK